MMKYVKKGWILAYRGSPLQQVNDQRNINKKLLLQED